MQLTCSMCPETFKSLILDRDAALQECVTKLVSHMEGKHRDTVNLYQAKLQQIVSVIAGRLIFTMFVNVEKIDEADPRGKHILDNFEKCDEEIIELLGLEEEEAEDEQEGNTKIDEDLNQNEKAISTAKEKVG